MVTSLREHWRHYVIEAAALGAFMAVVGIVAVALAKLPDPARSFMTAHAMLHRLIFGTAMGLTAIAIVYSPWGRTSGAHINPAVTLTYFLLDKMGFYDALFYVAAQFLGATIVFAAVARLLEPAIAQPEIHYVVTQPGMFGPFVALGAEFAIAFVMMTAILHLSNSSRFARYTGLCAGALVAAYITFEAPLSGMSLNPARTFASAFAAGDPTALWIYFIAPPAGMLTAALVYVYARGARSVRCAKLNHPATGECIFRCGYRQSQEQRYA
ncbi:MAG: aquaporin [Candidatus Eremiobacteraeota bacterium]|nr:aquaporin [Candidatus Eremiobacteraeota bacterium]